MRDPPASVHKSGASDPEKAKRRQVGHVMHSQWLVLASVHSTACPVLHQVHRQRPHALAAVSSPAWQCHYKRAFMQYATPVHYNRVQLRTCADQPARAGAAGVHLRHLQGRAGAAALHALQPRLLQALPAEDGALVLRLCHAVRARNRSCSTQFSTIYRPRFTSSFLDLQFAHLPDVEEKNHGRATRERRVQKPCPKCSVDISPYLKDASVCWQRN